jgi:very-short-patch-repair endonuclease
MPSASQLPYNPALKARARELRRAGILHEVLLWQHLKDGQLNGLDFDRQKIIGNYIVDFYCEARLAVIELDGSSHADKAEYDRVREQYLTSHGLRMIHLSAKEVLQQLAAVLEFLQQHPWLQAGRIPLP